MRTLPDGSLTVAALHPERSWTQERQSAADIVDSVYAAATALCGGDVDPNTMVDEEWLLGLERKGFVELARTPLTQARIEHMLKTGKPLRN